MCHPKKKKNKIPTRKGVCIHFHNFENVFRNQHGHPISTTKWKCHFILQHGFKRSQFCKILKSGIGLNALEMQWITLNDQHLKYHIGRIERRMVYRKGWYYSREEIETVETLRAFAIWQKLSCLTLCRDAGVTQAVLRDGWSLEDIGDGQSYFWGEDEKNVTEVLTFHV